MYFVLVIPGVLLVLSIAMGLRAWRIARKYKIPLPSLRVILNPRGMPPLSAATISPAQPSASNPAQSTSQPINTGPSIRDFSLGNSSSLGSKIRQRFGQRTVPICNRINQQWSFIFYTEYDFNENVAPTYWCNDHNCVGCGRAGTVCHY